VFLLGITKYFCRFVLSNWNKPVAVTTKTMKIQVQIEAYKIKISEPMISDTYYVLEENGVFHIESNNGYCTYGTDGEKTIESAIRRVKKMIKNYFIDRCEDNPKGW
jgi:hypothetical protein